MTTNCFVCYDNLATTATGAPTSERTGYSAANCTDWYTTSYWSPTSASGDHRIVWDFGVAVSADYFAIYRHNLAAVGGTVVLEHSPDNATWTAAFTATTATANELLIETFTSVSKRYWRVTFDLSSATPFYVGVVMFGAKLPLYRGMVAGFTVPRHGRKNDIVNQRTEGGQFVGRVKTSQGARSSIKFRHITQAWVRANWEAFVEHAELLPFLFSWNHDTYPQDAVYCVTDGEIPDISINDNHHHDINLPVQCLLSGDTL